MSFPLGLVLPGAPLGLLKEVQVVLEMALEVHPRALYLLINES